MHSVSTGTTLIADYKQNNDVFYFLKQYSLRVKVGTNNNYAEIIHVK